MRSYLLHNPEAGGGGHTEKELLSALKLGGIKAGYCSTKADEFVDVLSKKAERFVVAGGDGTIAKVVTQLPDRDCPVAIIPLGTANNVARSLGIAGSPQELAERFDFDVLRRLDIGLTIGPWGAERFVEAIGLGALAAAMAEKSSNEITSASRKIMRGRKALLRTLRKLDPFQLDISVDGMDHGGRFLAVEILNTPSSGPALPLAPDADPGDGWLDVLLVRADEREPFADWIAAAPGEGVADLGTRVRGRRVEFTVDASVALRVDDEIRDLPPSPSRVTVTIEPVPVQIATLSNGLKQKDQVHEAETVG